MNLLVDCHVFDGKFQGTRTYIEGLYSNLTNHSDIVFFFAARDVVRLKKIFGERQNIHYIQLQTGSGLKRLFVEFPKIVKKYSIDYAHFQYITPWKKKCKEIVTCHDLLFIDEPQFFPLLFRINKEFFFKRSAKRADILLTVSAYSKDALNRHFGISPDKIHITPNAVLPLENYSPKNENTFISGLGKYILTVSRIEPRKNHLNLLKAYVELKLYDKGYKLVMIGSLDLKYKGFTSYLQALPSNIRENIIIKSVPFEQLVELYKNTSLFVFPSYAEGFGIPPLEAIEYGSPLLCSNTTAMKEFPFHEECFFNPNDVEQLKKKILKFLDNKAHISYNKNAIAEKYQWRFSAETLYTLLKNNDKG